MSRVALICTDAVLPKIGTVLVTTTSLAVPPQGCEADVETATVKVPVPRLTGVSSPGYDPLTLRLARARCSPAPARLKAWVETCSFKAIELSVDEIVRKAVPARSNTAMISMEMIRATPRGCLPISKLHICCPGCSTPKRSEAVCPAP